MWLPSLGIKIAVDVARKWHKVEATRRAEEGADSIRIRDTRKFDHDAVGPLRLHERLRDAGAVDATLNDVADRGEICSGGADAVDWLHLVLHAQSAAQVEAQLGLDWAGAASCSTCGEAQIWE